MAFYPHFDNLTDTELKEATWWVTNKQKVILILFIVFILVTVLVWLSFGLKLINFFSVTKPQLAAQQAQLLTQANFSANQPQALILDIPTFFYNVNNTLDLAVRVTNSNPDWEVTALKFQFSLDGQTVPGQAVYLAPNQTTLLTIFHLPWNQALPQQVKVNLDPAWRKVSETVAGIGVDNITIQQSNQQLQASWTATNQTLRNYWLLPFEVAAFSQGQLVAVNTVSIEKFQLNESRPVSVSWFNQLPKVDQVEVYPKLDPYDSSNWWPGN